ncbi:MAG: mRNA surveillance protein pelota [Thermoplasmata archaeon]|nr:MAG: mRNA surveillance protein pelota [Thermoplasmata archaeon]RLF39452.1 MAG: mRNA surveillance protein pelota [Thermoplasmata archaeon]
MKVTHEDFKKGVVKLIPENMDDLWHLYNIIKKGDLVKGLTFRTAEMKSDRLRSKKMEKKPMFLGIRVEKVEFHQFSDRLRIHGIIEEGPQDIGSYHTINVKAGDFNELTVVKDKWSLSDIERLKEAVSSRGEGNIAFVSIDDEIAVVGIIRNSGIQIFAEISSDHSGKLYPSSHDEKSYFGEVLSALKNIIDEKTPLLIVGPGFTKDRFLSYGKEREKDLFNRVLVHGTGSAGINGVYEALRGGVAEKLSKVNRVQLETRKIEKVLEEISKDGAVTYGKKEVLDALEKGAVSELLILDNFARTEEGEKFLRLTKEMGGEFCIINSMNDAGKILEGLGGVAALLRFKLF